MNARAIELYMHHWAENVKAPRSRQNPSFADDIFKCIFEWESSYLVFYSIKVCRLGSNWQQTSIGPGNGLALNRGQAIILTNVDLFHGYMRHQASMS